MKRTATGIEYATVSEDDDDFLSQVAEAEAHALSSAFDSNSGKRRKITAVHGGRRSSPKANNDGEEKTEEGAYLAALRGSKSLQWQRSLVNGATNSNRSYGGAAELGGSNVSVPEKSCPCGLGVCNVFTANTEKNRGRKFYKCPESSAQENGGCGFFEWCDSASATNYTGSGPQIPASKSVFPDLPCPCGAGPCLVLTAKSGKNIGQQFYRCPANKESSCGFFKWCNDVTVTTGLLQNACMPKAQQLNESIGKSQGVKTASSCFKCGKEGHWAKDCSVASYNFPAGVKGLPQNVSMCKSYKSIDDSSHKSHDVKTGYSCFKCGNEGHWAKDCSVALYDFPAGVGGSSDLSSTCYKCSKPGHWAKDDLKNAGSICLARVDHSLGFNILGLAGHPPRLLQLLLRENLWLSQTLSINVSWQLRQHLHLYTMTLPSNLVTIFLFPITTSIAREKEVKNNNRIAHLLHSLETVEGETNYAAQAPSQVWLVM